MVTSTGKLALEMLVGDQTILDIAREVTRALEATDITGGIVGGIAVFLHGYERTTTDIDVYIDDRESFAEELTRRGFAWHAGAKEFVKNGIPVQLLAPQDKMPFRPSRFRMLHDIQIVTLGQLISMKLSTGTTLMHRAQDLADVVRLIETIPLDKSFVSQVDKAYREDFKNIIASLDQEK